MRRHTTPIFVIYLIYLAALAMTTALLVFWVLVVQRFTQEINQLVSRLGVEWNHFHWFIGSTGAALFFLVSVALTYLLAITLSERRYRVKQEHFLSNITHELKSPLAAIRLHAQTVQQGGLEEHEVGDFAGLIVQESSRIGTLVDNLLTSSRLSSGVPAGDLRPIDLKQFFQEYQEVVRSRFDLRQIDLRFEVQTRSVVMATSDALQRVMDNLIDNALRFTEAGGRILCEVRDHHEGAEIVVADTGAGIPKTELTRVFDRF
ncbi:MAG: HAMP domain-containing histidine kinase, partial [Holophagales bacterium]|nr:HAMP domain-containing histidine kinase [Holophagales bacterium]